MNSILSKKRLSFLGVLFVLAGICLGAVSPVFAYSIKHLPQVENEGDFTVGPGKVEVFLEPGGRATKNLRITNRLGRKMEFQIETEDFKGSPTGEKPAVLLGGREGPYSLKDFIEPELKKFTLKQGEKITLPVTISISEDMEPGGLYGSVLVSTAPTVEEKLKSKKEAKGQVGFVSRIATLFFVRIKGAAKEEAHLEKFDTVSSKSYFAHGPVSLQLSYRNTGNVHLNPYGRVEFKNIWGKKVGEKEIKPYFVMPQSLRRNRFKWEKDFGLGRYTAELSLNKGYKNKVVKAKSSFWILPWRVIGGIAFVVFILVFLLWWLATRFEIQRKGAKASGGEGSVPDPGPEEAEEVEKSEGDKRRQS